MMSNILIAHPGKHHALHLAAGCVKAGATVDYVTPFYRRGLGRLVSRTPGSVGAGARGYYSDSLPMEYIVAPTRWQVRKLWSIYRGRRAYESAFDEYVAARIARGSLGAATVVTLQDYMPRTVRAAKAQGSFIWSDQISNQSAEASARIRRHEEAYGLGSSWRHDERVNAEIVRQADLVTAPSAYCMRAIQEFVDSQARTAVVPYGAFAQPVSVARVDHEREVVVLARAHSIRKGGHLLCRALSQCGSELVELCSPTPVRITVLGEPEPALKGLLDALSPPIGLSLEYGNIPHQTVLKMYGQASLFVMPSLSEGMSLACVEAMHAGLPLIVSEYCGLDDFVHGQMGYLITDTPESLASALVAAFVNRRHWPDWGAETRRLARRLTWAAYESAICDLVSSFAC